MGQKHSERIARVFPRRTAATPDDELAFFDVPGFPLKVDEVHVSVTFSYDIIRAEQLGKAWGQVAPVKFGGPALGDSGADFKPGMYVKKGYVFTSRGCPNNCWFCDVHKREGNIRELPITEGWNLLDSNILACSMDHITKVFEMLKRQRQKAQFTGGLEAKILTWDHVGLLWDLRPDQMFFAYDTPDDLDPLIEAGKKLRFANFTRRHLRCYVLIGWPRDTIDDAEKRLMAAWEAGFMPMAMLWKNRAGATDLAWRKFQKIWARPAVTKSLIKDMFLERKDLERYWV